MSLKASALKLYLSLINQWMDSLKSLDAKSLRFIRGNLQLFLTLAKRNHSTTLALGRPFRLSIPQQNHLEFAEQVGVKLAWKEQAGSEPNLIAGEITACIVTTMRAMTLRRLIRTLQMHHLDFEYNWIIAQIAIIQQHAARISTAPVFGLISTNAINNERDIFFSVLKKGKQGRLPAISLVQATTYARKADRQPVMAAGTQIMVRLMP